MKGRQIRNAENLNVSRQPLEVELGKLLIFQVPVLFCPPWNEYGQVVIEPVVLKVRNQFENRLFVKGWGRENHLPEPIALLYESSLVVAKQFPRMPDRP